MQALDSQLNNKLFDLLTFDRDVTKPDFITPELYGPSPNVSDNLPFVGTYAQLLNQPGAAFIDADTQRKSATNELDLLTLSQRYTLYYTVFEPVGLRKPEPPLVILLPGVPADRYEWFPVARILGRFMRVVVLDYLGMGQSSQPLGFGKNWRWATQAKALHLFVHHLMNTVNPHWFETGYFVGGSDWGGGVVQKYGELYHDHMKPNLMGLWLVNPIALNGYWTPQIGALTAFTRPELDNPGLPVQAEALVGNMTTLLEGMFHRTSEKHNKHSLAWLQGTYFNHRAYNDVTKNPGNTEVYWGALRCLAEQASEALGNGELLPYHDEDNPGGLKFTRWDFPVLVTWGANDKMMPDNQGWRFTEIIIRLIRMDRALMGQPNKLEGHFDRIANAGHFSNYDQPEATVDAFLKFLTKVSVRAAAALHRPYIGLDTIARQDETRLLDELDKINTLALSRR